MRQFARTAVPSTLQEPRLRQIAKAQGQQVPSGLPTTLTKFTGLISRPKHNDRLLQLWRRVRAGKQVLEDFKILADFLYGKHEVLDGNAPLYRARVCELADRFQVLKLRVVRFNDSFRMPGRWLIQRSCWCSCCSWISYLIAYYTPYSLGNL